MKLLQKAKRPLMLAGLCLLFAGAVAVFAMSNRSVLDNPPPIIMESLMSQPTRPAGCVPLPASMFQVKGTPTLTPQRGVVTSPMPLRASVTPIPFTIDLDLDPQLSIIEKMEVVVFRCNGNFERYYISPLKDFNKEIPLFEGDIYFSIAPPAASMGVPPDPVITSTSMPPTTIPYPVEPISPTMNISTPYPIP